MVRLRLSTEQRIASFIPAIIRVSMLEVFDSYAGLWRKEKGNMIEKIKELKDIGGGGGSVLLGFDGAPTEEVGSDLFKLFCQAFARRILVESIY
jgi:hypothetical protein